MALDNFGSFSLVNNQFAVELYSNLIATKPRNENGILSPFSVLTALSMVNVGARRATREQILNSTKLNLIGNSTMTDAAFKSVFSKMDIHIDADRRAFDETDYGKYVALANRIYLQKSFHVKPEFGRTLKASYNATFGKVDFAKNPAKAAKEINQWVGNVTAHKIQNLFEKIDNDVRFALVSAIYFKADWLHPFPVSSTCTGDFFGETGTSKVQLMRQKEKRVYYATFPDLNATALMKWYHGRSTMTMFIILPDQKNGLGALERKLTPELFNTDRYRMVQASITLPKFKIASNFNLEKALKQMGIVDAFSNQADFTGISTEQLKISDAVHKTFIDVYEKGTEAAAATGFTLSFRSADPPVRKLFRANHPFLFAIQDSSTEAVLFIGRVSTLKESTKDGARVQVNSTDACPGHDEEDHWVSDWVSDMLD